MNISPPSFDIEEPPTRIINEGFLVQKAHHGSYKSTSGGTTRNSWEAKLMKYKNSKWQNMSLDEKKVSMGLFLTDRHVLANFVSI